MATLERPLGLQLSYFRRFMELHGGRLETLESLESFFRERCIDDPVVWFCVFNNNQHRASEHPFAWWQSTFQESLAAINNVVMVMHPWKNPVTLTRSWCIFEVYVTITVGANFDVALAPSQEARFFDDILTDISAFYNMLATVSSEAAQATVPTDKTNIDRVITSTVGFTGLDRMVLETFEAWMKRAIRGRIAVASTALEKARLFKALAEFVSLNGAFVEAEALGTEALALYLEALGPEAPATLFMQGLLAMFQGHQYKPRDVWEPTLVDVIRKLTEPYEKVGECALAIDAWEAAIDGFLQTDAKDQLPGCVWNLYWARHTGDLWPSLACIQALVVNFERTELLHEGWGLTTCLACELPMLEGITYICPGCTINLGVVCASCHEFVTECLDCERSVLLPAEPPARTLLKMRVKWLTKEGPSDALRAANDALTEYYHRWHLPLE
ncbi:hypothetical protein SPRG_21699 [Saprolegnia parasitica CBS 223.65]|uniref:Uncharacterized protein n=1 Tax=Saprolegnia parasitica (strain CBS 223.65) TaxID=695850 RepID=A0A067BIS6_SAPPC|nr:hypothetical protein SPRG_21699 [Saprolegnia parasitica CBS 223.65]KDO18299.1 hypothetical protein SPRG_21699 [Saprolegnia parasitica CBS 223.65]|eukprot:XP_012210995.1 hypothetical protein SPRG_21699 [Saprolegnia parasitica CBS 223.65]